MDKSSGGGGGIRTHGTREGTTVFETVPIDHSGTPPQGSPPGTGSAKLGPSRARRSEPDPAHRPNRRPSVIKGADTTQSLPVMQTRNGHPDVAAGGGGRGARQTGGFAARSAAPVFILG
jgi:hypothetical protein